MANQRPFPEIPPGLMKRLEKQFKDRMPRNELSQFELGKLAGHQELMDLLRRNFEKQQEPSHVHETT